MGICFHTDVQRGEDKMKELTKKSRILVFIVADVLFSIIVAATIWSWVVLCIPPRFGIGHRGHYKKTDDKLSAAVCEAMGTDFVYLGKEESDSGVTEYEYQVKKLEKDAVTNMVNALNDAVENEQGKIRVIVYLGIPGGFEPAFIVENFSDDGLEAADYDGMYAICIQKPDIADGTCFDHPSVYTGIEGIRKLRIDPRMKTQAEKEGIDWYKLWPDLEEVG